MYIAYSALRTPVTTGEQLTKQAHDPISVNEQLLRHQAYQVTCDKYRYEIAAIQKYMPDWQPKFY